MRVDTRGARAALHAATRRRARPARSGAGSASAASSSTVRDYAWWGGQAELTWALTPSWGRRAGAGTRRPSSLTGKLLGARQRRRVPRDRRSAPSVPSTATAVGRLVRRRSGAYGVELALREAARRARRRARRSPPRPTRLELALSAVRRTREDFVRRIEVTTLDGTEVRKVKRPPADRSPPAACAADLPRLVGVRAARRLPRRRAAHREPHRLRVARRSWPRTLACRRRRPAGRWTHHR